MDIFVNIPKNQWNVRSMGDRDNFNELKLVLSPQAVENAFASQLKGNKNVFVWGSTDKKDTDMIVDNETSKGTVSANQWILEINGGWVLCRKNQY